MLSADEIFRAELKAREISYSVTDQGLYEIEVEGNPLTVDFENVRRNYQRDGDAEAIARFVENVGSSFLAATPPWKQVRNFVRYSLEPSNYGEGFGDVFANALSDELSQVFVYTLPDGSRITWINKSMLRQWNVDRTEVAETAEKNMAAIVSGATFEVEEIEGNRLGMLSTEEVAFKASLVLSPTFRDLVSASHGWPVYVVVPCRDFAYVVREDNRELLGRLGRVVVEEFQRSGYPITTDVLRISDEGIEAVATYSTST